MRALLLAALLVPAVAAQPDPACALGEATGVVDVAGVRVRLLNIGSLFWKSDGQLYEVPKGSGRSPLFHASLWVGGLVDAEVRAAAPTYGPWQYWPGPLDANGQTTAETCAAFDRIWVVSGPDLDAFEATGTATADLREWPIALGAPYYTDADGNGVQGEAEPTVSLDLGEPGYGTRTLDLAAGERPVIFGRQTAWWVMNDAGGPHGENETEPLGIEVRTTVWARGGEDESGLHESTFVRYEVINRSGRPIDAASLGLYVDPDLGDHTDDRSHADSTRSMYVYYNADETDEGPSGYGVPPAFGVDLLTGGYTAITVSNSGTFTSHAGTGEEAYRYMQGRWKDGSPVRAGGFGYGGTGPITRWVYWADPLTGAFWSQENLDGNGGTSTSRYGFTSAQIGDLAPGDRAVVDIGLLFAQGTDRFDSIVRLRDVSDLAQALHDAGTLAARLPEPQPPASAPSLASPAPGERLGAGSVTFAWNPPPDATGYRLQVALTAAFDSLLVDAFTSKTERVVEGRTFPYNRSEPFYWRVLSENLGVPGPASQARAFVRFRKAFSSFEVVANASGPIAPHPGAAAFQGFPTPGGENPGAEQQTNGTQWLLAAGQIAAYDDFLDVVLREDNADRAFPRDLELRFTGPSTAYRRFQDGATLEVPFELWDTGVGTPDDPSDDVRMVVAVHDDPGAGTVGNGVFDLSTRDSPVSTSDNDPESDWVYAYRPTDTSPGDAGYLGWLASADTAPRSHGPEVLARLAFVGWNLGTAPPYPAAMPEPGTVFRLVSNDLLGVAAADGPVEPHALSVTVSPNPVRSTADVGYRLAVAGAVRLRVLDVLGREVAVLADGVHTPGAHTARLDASALAAGVYLVVVDTEAGRAARTLTIVR